MAVGKNKRLTKGGKKGDGEPSAAKFGRCVKGRASSARRARRAPPMRARKYAGVSGKSSGKRRGGDGSSGGAIEHLASQLDLLEARPAPSPGSAPRVLDAALRQRVLTFQRSQGLKADGQPGPMTFMQLDSATGINPVRLQTEPR